MTVEEERMRKKRDQLRLEFMKREEVPEPTKEDRELMLLWNLRLFPFLERNYDVIFSKTRLKRLKRTFLF